MVNETIQVNAREEALSDFLEVSSRWIEERRRSGLDLDDCIEYLSQFENGEGISTEDLISATEYIDRSIRDIRSVRNMVDSIAANLLREPTAEELMERERRIVAEIFGSEG